MKITAEEIKAKELNAGDLFSTASQTYRDNQENTLSIAEYEYDDMKEMPMSPEFYSLQDKLGNLL